MKKIIACIACVFISIVCLSVQSFATSYTPYSDGSISTTYMDYFSGIVSKFSHDVHYTLFRSGQYDYIFAYGKDLSISNRTISGSAKIINLNTYNSYNNGYNLSYSSDSNFSVNSGQYFLYSDLGSDFPILSREGRSYENQALLFAIGCISLFFLITRIYYFKR